MWFRSKHDSCIHEVWNSNSQHLHKKTGMASVLVTLTAVIGGRWILDAPRLAILAEMTFRFRKRPCLMGIRQRAAVVFLQSPHAHVWAQIRKRFI